MGMHVGAPSGAVARCAAVLCLLSAFGEPASANDSQILGSVIDASAAGVPGATVTVLNFETGLHRVAVTDERGFYQLPSLPSGRYDIYTGAPGMAKTMRTGVEVHVAEALRLDFKLEMRPVREAITVSADGMSEVSSDVSLTFAGRQVQEAPLNGRNVLSLLSAVSGVVPQASSAESTAGNQFQGSFTNPFGWGNLQMGGAMAGQSAFFLDGVSLNSPWSGTVGIVPAQDSIQEFRVSTFNAGVEFGGFMGGVAEFETKRGANSLHGTLYEYVRNRGLNANYFFNNRSGLDRPAFVQNQYGAAIGGPVRRERTFFFESWESFEVRQGTPLLTTVPTIAARSGNFSGMPANYDPWTSPRTPFPNNVIPASRFDQAARRLIRLWALPNVNTPGGNYAANGSTGSNQTEDVARVDHTISDKQRFFGRYSWWNGKTQPYNPFFNESGTSATLYHAHQAVAGDTWSVSPVLLGDFRSSYMRTVYSLLPPSTGKANLSQYGPAWAALAGQVTYQENPVPAVSGYYAFGNMDTHNLAITNQYVLAGSVTRIMSRQSLKMGGEARRSEFYFAQLTNASGSFSFNNGFTSANATTSSPTGSGFASFLLGTPASGSIGTASRTGVVNGYRALYITDTYQMSRRLTVTLGVRWELPGMYSEKKDRLTELLPNAVDPLSQQTGLNLRGQLALVNSTAYPGRQTLATPYREFEPRVGVAWQAVLGTVVRTGYGISHQALNRVFLANSPVTVATTAMVTSLDGGITPAYTLSNPFPNGIIQPSLRDPAFVGTVEGNALTGPVANQALPYIQQWNFGIQKEVTGLLLVDVSYAGAKGTHLPRGAQNINQLPNEYDSLGLALLASNPGGNPFAGKLPTTSVLNAATITVGQLLRPYPQFTAVTIVPPTIGNSIYHSLQTKIVKRFKSGGTLLGAYTWSKNISDSDTGFGFLESNAVGGIQDFYDPRASRSLTSFDVVQRLVVSYVVDLTFGRGSRWLGNVKGAAGKLVSGWRLNGITTYQSGFPLPLTAQATTLQTTFGAGTTRPNVVAGCDKTISGPAQERLSG